MSPKAFITEATSIDIKTVVLVVGAACAVAVGLYKTEALGQSVKTVEERVGKNTPRIEAVEREQAVNAEQHRQILQALLDLKSEIKEMRAEVKSAASLMPRRLGP
jgi:septal ring factor EnvC (AmiA/AmiB activator)